DGIRDKLVTGVQTCALPISSLGATEETAGRRAIALRGAAAKRKSEHERAPPDGDTRPERYSQAPPPNPRDSRWRVATRVPNCARSEERRVGKGCGCRVSREG